MTRRIDIPLRESQLQMVEEIRWILARHPGVQTFILDDDLFTLDRAHAEGFARAYVEAGFTQPWVANAHVKQLDAGLARALAAQAGAQPALIDARGRSGWVLRATSLALLAVRQAQLRGQLLASLGAGESVALGDQGAAGESYSASLDMAWEVDLFGSKRLSLAASQADLESEQENPFARGQCSPRLLAPSPGPFEEQKGPYEHPTGRQLSEQPGQARRPLPQAR